MPNINNRPVTLPPFIFKEKNKFIDWDALSNADVEALKTTGDLLTIQNCGRELVFSQLHKSDLDRINDTNFIKLFKISQLSIEYLLYVQEFLETVARSAGNEFNKFHKLCEEAENTAKEQRQNIVKLKKGVHAKEEEIKAYDFLIKEAGKIKLEGAYPCRICKNKYYSSQKALEGHYVRRHSSVDPCSSEVSREVSREEPKPPEIPLKVIEEQVRNTMQEELVGFQKMFEVFGEKLNDNSRTQQLIASNRQHENTLMTKLREMQSKIDLLQQINTTQVVKDTLEPIKKTPSVHEEIKKPPAVKREPFFETCTIDLFSFTSKKATEKATEKPIEKPIEKPAEKLTEKPTEKPAEKPTEEQKEVKPEIKKQPLQRQFSQMESITILRSFKKQKTEEPIVAKVYEPERIMQSIDIQTEVEKEEEVPITFEKPVPASIKAEIREAIVGKPVKATMDSYSRLLLGTWSLSKDETMHIKLGEQNVTGEESFVEDLGDLEAEESKAEIDMKDSKSRVKEGVNKEEIKKEDISIQEEVEEDKKEEISKEEINKGEANEEEVNKDEVNKEGIDKEEEEEKKDEDIKEEVKNDESEEKDENIKQEVKKDENEEEEKAKEITKEDKKEQIEDEEEKEEIKEERKEDTELKEEIKDTVIKDEKVDEEEKQSSEPYNGNDWNKQIEESDKDKYTSVLRHLQTKEIEKKPKTFKEEILKRVTSFNLMQSPEKMPKEYIKEVDTQIQTIVMRDGNLLSNDLERLKNRYDQILEEITTPKNKAQEDE